MFPPSLSIVLNSGRSLFLATNKCLDAWGIQHNKSFFFASSTPVPSPRSTSKTKSNLRFFSLTEKEIPKKCSAIKTLYFEKTISVSLLNHLQKILPQTRFLPFTQLILPTLPAALNQIFITNYFLAEQTLFYAYSFVKKNLSANTLKQHIHQMLLEKNLPVSSIASDVIFSSKNKRLENLKQNTWIFLEIAFVYHPFKIVLPKTIFYGKPSKTDLARYKTTQNLLAKTASILKKGNSFETSLKIFESLSVSKKKVLVTIEALTDPHETKQVLLDETSVLKNFRLLKDIPYKLQIKIFDANFTLQSADIIIRDTSKIRLPPCLKQKNPTAHQMPLTFP